MHLGNNAVFSWQSGELKMIAKRERERESERQYLDAIQVSEGIWKRAETKLDFVDISWLWRATALSAAIERQSNDIYI